MVKLHMGIGQKYPDRKPVHAVPYGGTEDLRSESNAIAEIFLAGKPGKWKLNRA